MVRGAAAAKADVVDAYGAGLQREIGCFKTRKNERIKRDGKGASPARKCKRLEIRLFLGCPVGNRQRQEENRMEPTLLF